MNRDEFLLHRLKEHLTKAGRDELKRLLRARRQPTTAADFERIDLAQLRRERQQQKRLACASRSI